MAAYGSGDITDYDSGFVDYYCILKKDGNKINVVYEEDVARGYGIYTVRLVKMTGSEKSYIYLGTTNGVSMIGFDLLDLSNNSITVLASVEDPSGSGGGDLFDSNDDGYYDGYTKGSASYYNLYYPVYSYYNFNDGEFVFDRTDVDIPDYPTTVEETVVQYITLRVLGNSYDSADISNRTTEMDSVNPISRVYRTKFPTEIWYDAISKYDMQLEDAPVITVTIFPDEASVDVEYTSEGIAILF